MAWASWFHRASLTRPRVSEAQPIIDVQITVERLALHVGWLNRLVRLGYIHHPSPDDIEYPFFRRPTGWPHAHDPHLDCRTAISLVQSTPTPGQL